MNFLDTWQQLDEIYQADYNTTGAGEAFKEGRFVGPLYHFYEDLADLLNSLKHGIIYSTKNDKDENPAQFDYSLDNGQGDGRAYICMTNTLAGKNYMVNKFHRPFGLAFKADSLNRMLNSHTISAYSAFGSKGDYTYQSKTNKKDGTPRKKTNPTLLASTPEYGSNPFTIYSIGKLDEDLYFVCGGQGTNKLWSGQTFSDSELYEKLKAWFMENLGKGNEYQRRMYYHFKNGQVLSDEKDKQQYYKDAPITAAHNLNQFYKPRLDKKTGKDGSYGYSATIDFRFKGPYKDKFIEVLGYGPINATDAQGKELLTLNMVDPHVKSGYRGPLLFGKNIDNQTYAGQSTYIKAKPYSATSPDEEDRIASTQFHMVADEKIFNGLMQIFNENEYRIYMKNSLDFRFRLDDLFSVVLPEAIRLASYGETINIRKLAYNIENNIKIDYTDDFILKEHYIVLTDSDLKRLRIADLDAVTRSRRTDRSISNYAKTLIKYLVEILSNPALQGDKVAYELVPDTAGALPDIIKAKATLGSFLRTGETVNGVTFNKNGKVTAGDKARKVLSKHDLPMAGIITDGQNGEQTVIGPVIIPGVVDPIARLGSEVVLIAEDEASNKYVLFVYKSKSSSFMELPGGGFSDLPNGEKAYEDLLKDKLLFKCNISDSQISNLTDTGEALILHENGVAKDKDVAWDWSYYRLFTAKYVPVLTEEELAALGYTYDNRAVASSKSMHGYRAHMRWVPVDSIELNRSITDRYSNIIPIIKSLAERF